MTELERFVELAYQFHHLREPILRSSIQALQLPSGSQGLDAGCGIGLQSMMLADVVGPKGQITGLDLSPEYLTYGRDLVNKAGLSERVLFREGDVNKLPFDDDCFDWAWSMDCVGYAPIDPLPLICELARVVKPGGSVAILAWSAEKLLPGYPVLEARLNATTAGISPFVKGKQPEMHFSRALGWFRDAGLRKSTSRTFVADAHAPLTDDLRSTLLALFQMRWPGVESELTQEDWTEFQRVCLPESPDFILDHPDYYAFFTYSMFQGKVTG
jgi:demethylmenaquinone methyltransferase/2-methoxy-6-polyprenyl-1,4-benzoquinol methylase